MIRSSPPLRLLAVILGGWLFLRVAMIAPGWWERAPVKRVLSVAPFPIRDGVQRNADTPALIARASQENYYPQRSGNGFQISSRRDLTPSAATAGSAMGRPVHRERPFVGIPAVLGPGGPARSRREETQTPLPYAGLPIEHRPPRRGSGRWSGTAFLFIRGEGSPSIAPGGTLGGSQAGARLAYRLNSAPHRPLALVTRLYTPLDRPAGTEVAAGLQWRPLRSLPVQILAERRQALGREGRSAFSLTLHGGASGAIASSIRYDVYGQAGIVGVRSRDVFADGAVRMGRSVGPVEIGAGLFGAAQPGALRVDVGPRLSTRIKAGGANLQLAAEWRMRVAGEVSPGSGPSFMLATDF